MTVPAAARRVIADAFAEAQAAGITSPAAAAEYAACALTTHGWYVTGHPTTTPKDNSPR